MLMLALIQPKSHWIIGILAVSSAEPDNTEVSCSIYLRAAGPLTVSPRGQILVPNSCPGFLVKNFIQQKKDEAAVVLLEYYR
jgi:hypothetical protein